MAFDADNDFTTEMQAAVGLHQANINLPRTGDKNVTGKMGASINSSHYYATSLNNNQSRLIIDTIPAEVKNNGDMAPDLAVALAKLYDTASMNAPEAVTAKLPEGAKESPGGVYVVSPGGALITGKTQSSMFGAFVYNNQDAPRTKWAHMTGEEQWEWYRVWRDVCGRTHERREDQTRGLRGTNLIRRVPDEETLEAVLPSTPSLKRRRRPENHPVNEIAWAAKINSLAD